MRRPRHVSLNDLVAHWCPCVLELECECRDRAAVLRPLVQIAEETDGGRQTMGRLLARLRCSRCHARPTRITLREAIISADRRSWSLGWRYPLPVPSPAPQPRKYNARNHVVAAGVEYWHNSVEMEEIPEWDD